MTLNTDTLPVREKTNSEASTAGEPKEVIFGRPLLKEFLLDPAYRNLNQGTLSPPLPFLLIQHQLTFSPKAPSAPSPAQSSPRNASTKTESNSARTSSSVTNTPVC